MNPDELCNFSFLHFPYDLCTKPEKTKNLNQPKKKMGWGPLLTRLQYNHWRAWDDSCLTGVESKANIGCCWCLECGDLAGRSRYISRCCVFSCSFLASFFHVRLIDYMATMTEKRTKRDIVRNAMVGIFLR